MLGNWCKTLATLLRPIVAAAMVGSALGAAACSEDAAAPRKDAASGGDVPVTLADGQICVPKSYGNCLNSLYIQRCSADGSGWLNERCADDQGNDTQCANNRCAVCTPGIKRCGEVNQLDVELCTESGQWEKQTTCNAAEGQICAQGLCQKACDVSAKAKSYTGCAFWAADLDNAFVPGGSRSYYDAANAQYAIVVSNPSNVVSSVVSIFNELGKQELDSLGQPLDYSPLKPGELRVFNLPPRNIEQTSLEPLAWRVTSTAPIAAYQFNPLENVNVYSNDASLLLPDEALGQYYIAMSREQSFSILRGFVTVVGTRDGAPTKVTVTFGPKTGRTLSGSIKKLNPTSGKVEEVPIPVYQSGGAATFEVAKGQVLNLESDQVGSDLTGTVIQADKPVAVFAGSEAANVPNTNRCEVSACSEDALKKGDKCGVCAWDNKTPCNNNEHCGQFITCCADHLEMQMFPVKTWGSHYVGIKLQPRGKEPDTWRILAATDGTRVTLSPAPKDAKTGKVINVPVLNAGEWYEFDTGGGEIGGSFEITAAHTDGTPAPVLVGHFMSSQDAPAPGVQADDAGTGDPAFLLAIPVEQWRQDYVFLTPSKYSTNFISIAAPIHRSCVAGAPRQGAACAIDEDCFEPGQDVLPSSCVDDVVVTFDGEVVPADLFAPVNKSFKYARLFVNPGTHTVRALSVPDADNFPQPRYVAVDAYGFDNYVSYGYPAGLDLKDTQQFKEPGQQ